MQLETNISFQSRKKKKNITLLVAGSEDDDPGLVTDDALRDADLAWSCGDSGAAACGTSAGGDGFGADDLYGEGVADGARAELVHLAEDGLPQRRLLASLRHRHRRRHGRRLDSEWNERWLWSCGNPN